MYRFRMVVALLVLWTGVTAAAVPSDERDTKIQELMDLYEEKGLFSGAVLAAEHGEIVHEGAYGFANHEWETPNTVDTRFRIASISKPFTQILVLQLVEEGKLSLDGTIADYLPDYSGEGGDRITIQQLLVHRSGIVSESAVPNLDDIERISYTREELLEHIAGYKLQFKPGSRWGYSNFGYYLLGAIVEEVSDKSYAELLEGRICGPAGMTNTMHDVNRPLIERRASGYHYYPNEGIVNAPYLDMSFVFGYGHLLSSVRDLFLWDKALRGNKLLSLEHTGFILQAAAEEDPLGSSRRKVDVVRFGGSINGFLCSTHSYTQDDRFVVVLANVKDSRGAVLPSTFDVARNIAAILYGERYKLPE